MEHGPGSYYSKWRLAKTRSAIGKMRLMPVDRREVQLTPTEFEVLKYLMKYQGKVLSPDAILANAWARSTSVSMSWSSSSSTVCGPSWSPSHPILATSSPFAVPDMSLKVTALNAPHSASRNFLPLARPSTPSALCRPI